MCVTFCLSIISQLSFKKERKKKLVHTYTSHFSFPEMRNITIIYLVMCHGSLDFP